MADGHSAQRDASCTEQKLRKPGADLYERRLQKEMGIPEQEIQARMRWDLPVLSENTKCSVSLDLPVLNCRPTGACSEVCYASQGCQMFRHAIIKSLAANRMIMEDPERVASP